MNDLSFSDCFGANASQDINSITILKIDLPELTPTTSNNAEALVVGILLKILENFQGELIDETGDNITDEFDIPIGYNQGDIYNFQLFHWRDILRNRQGINYKIYQLVLHEFIEDA